MGMDHKQKQEELRKKLTDIMGRKSITFLKFSKEIGVNATVVWAFIRRNSNLHQGNFYKIEQYINQQKQVEV
jgi:hypothetical protein